MTIEQLQAEEKELLKLIHINKQKQCELNKIKFIKEHGVNIGDTVEYSSKMNGQIDKKGVISGIEFQNTTPNFYLVNLFNSNGKLSERSTRIWSFCFDSIKVINKG
jgi:hypothetical protein